jgi:hypothetical protein
VKLLFIHIVIFLFCKINLTFAQQDLSADQLKQFSKLPTTINNTKLYDSIMGQLLGLRLDANKDKDILELCKQYASNNKYGSNKQIANTYIKYAITQEEKAEAALLQCIVIDDPQNDTTLQSLDKAFYYSNLGISNILKIKILLEKGKYLAKINRKLEAYQHYTDAIFLAKKINNYNAICQAEDVISNFFNEIKDYDNAITHKKNGIAQLIIHPPVDSVKYYELQSTICLYYFNCKKTNLAMQTAYPIINYSILNNINDLHKNIFKIIRTSLLDDNNADILEKLYITDYPEQWAQLRHSDTLIYIRTKAIFDEQKGNIAEASTAMQYLEQNLDKTKSVYNLCYFYKRYAEFTTRQFGLIAAKQKYEKQYQYALQVEFYPWIIDALEHLVRIDSSTQNYALAFARLQELNKYETLSTNSIQADKLLRISIDNNEKQRQLEQEQIQQQINKKHNLQYMAIVIAILSCFIILAIIGSTHLPRIFIRAIAFISFIFLFEFIILLADEKIHHATHGEPLKIMIIKLVLIAILMPIHHALEHRVIHYLSEHRLFDFAKMLAWCKNKWNLKMWWQNIIKD